MVEPFEIQELKKNPSTPITVSYDYVTDSYFDIDLRSHETGWTINLELKKLKAAQEKRSTSVLFGDHVEGGRVFAGVQSGRILGYLQIGYESWNHRLRVWDLWVDRESRRMGVGACFMRHIQQEAIQLGARAIVLETQSCNVPAIRFYQKSGFQLIGFDLIHYTNQDIVRGEARIELGMTVS